MFDAPVRRPGANLNFPAAYRTRLTFLLAPKFTAISRDLLERLAWRLQCDTNQAAANFRLAVQGCVPIACLISLAVTATAGMGVLKCSHRLLQPQSFLLDSFQAFSEVT